VDSRQPGNEPHQSAAHDEHDWIRHRQIAGERTGLRDGHHQPGDHKLAVDHPASVPSAGGARSDPFRHGPLSTLARDADGLMDADEGWPARQLAPARGPPPAQVLSVAFGQCEDFWRLLWWGMLADVPTGFATCTAR
jgi:hypothetical protein